MEKIHTKLIKNILCGLLVVTFSLAPFGFSKMIFPVKKAHSDEPEEMPVEYITVSTTWYKGETHIFDTSVVVDSDVILTIEPGVTIKFNESSDGNPLFFIINGIVLANGTHEDPIKFMRGDASSGFAINYSGSIWIPSFFRYVEVIGGGAYFDDPPPQANLIDKTFLNIVTAQEVNGLAAFNHEKGLVNFENSRFYSSHYADVKTTMRVSDVDKNRNKILIANSNFEGGLGHNAVISEMDCYLENEDECKAQVILRNNWYGIAGGPGVYGSVVGLVQVNGWRTKKLIADPVVIIPGITGCAEANGKWLIDPILHTYDDLIESFETNGYEKGINLFGFPYDWRKSNVDTAKDLRERVEGIAMDVLVSKVDLVAHSMGGLVARQYVQNDPYGGFLFDQLITLGTPHLGSPESYLKWEAGEGFLTKSEKIAKHHFRMEAKHEGYDNIFSYIQDKISSVRELLPTFDYLYDVEDEKLREYPDNYPRNTFLEELNAPENVAKLSTIDSINIVGARGSRSTIDEIKVVSSTVENRWEHGMPENFEDDNIFGLVYGEGDETVPLRSATGIVVDKTIGLNEGHSKLPTKAQCKIISELAPISEDDCVYQDDWDIPNIMMFNLFSPVDVQVISPDGKRVGKDFETGEILNEIDGAYYSGFDTENEMLTIPNPVEGEYRVITKGTGEGEYKVEVTKISEDESLPEGAREKTVELTGIAVMDQEEEFALGLDSQAEEELEIIEDKDEIAPEIMINSPEKKEYLNNQKLKIEYEVKDNVSADEAVLIEMYLDGERIDNNELDLPFLNLSEHKLEIIAKDEVGNEGRKDVIFNVITNLDALKDNVDYYYGSGMIKNEKERNFLRWKLQNIENTQKLKEFILKHTRKDKKKEKIERVFDKIIQNEIYQLIRHIRIFSPRLIDDECAEVLVDNLKWLTQDQF